MTWTQKRTACERLGQFAPDSGNVPACVGRRQRRLHQAAKDKTAPVEPAKGDKASFLTTGPVCCRPPSTGS